MKMEVVVKVGVESEVAMHENGKWWSKWVWNLEWQKAAGCENGKL
jgi:hypothetical protein